MRNHDDADFELEQRLRRIAANPQPEAPSSVYRRAADVARGELRGRANGVALVPVLRGGRRSGIRQAGALAGLAAALVVAVAAMGLLAGQHGPNPGSPGPVGGRWTGLEWHDITATASGGSGQDHPWWRYGPGGTGALKWRGGFAMFTTNEDVWTSEDGLSWVRSANTPGVFGLTTLRGDLLAQAEAGVWISTDAVDWRRIAVPFDPHLSVLASSPEVAVAAVQGAGLQPGPLRIYATRDSTVWEVASIPTNMAGAQFQGLEAFFGGFRVTGLVQDPNGTVKQTDADGVMRAYAERTWTSPDGLTWSSYEPKVPPGRSADELSYWGTAYGRLGAVSSTLRSSDGGATWVEDSRSPAATRGNAVVASDGDRIVMAVEGGARFYVSEGDGNWRMLDQGGDIGSLPYGGRPVLLPNGLLWVTNDGVYFGQGLSGVAPRGSLSPVTTPLPEPTVAVGSPVAECTRLPMRSEAAAELVKRGAVIVYERNGGISCVDALYAIYSDGRVVSDFGDGHPTSSQLPANKVTSLLDAITTTPDAANGWFTDGWYNTYHMPCAACYTYSLTVTYKGQTKTVTAVDGGTDAMPEYWIVTGYLAEVIPLPAESGCCGIPFASGSSAPSTTSSR